MSKQELQENIMLIAFDKFLTPQQVILGVSL